MARPQTEHSVGYLVKRVQLILRRACDDTLRPTGVSMAQHAVLRALSDHPDASAAQLARLCFVTRQSLGDVLESLLATGLVESTDMPPRGRAQPLRLTPAGRERLQLSTAAVADVESTMTQGMPAGAREDLARLLTVCAETLETRSAASTPSTRSETIS